MEIVINGSDIKIEVDFYKYLVVVLDFLFYYGSNLDVFWDILSIDIE